MISGLDEMLSLYVYLTEEMLFHKTRKCLLILDYLIIQKKYKKYTFKAIREKAYIILVMQVFNILV